MLLGVTLVALPGVSQPVLVSCVEDGSRQRWTGLRGRAELRQAERRG